MGQEPVLKVFSWYGNIPQNGDETIVTVPAGWHAIIDHVAWDLTNAQISVKFGVTVAFTYLLGTQFALGGCNLAYGAAGNDLHVTEANAGADCYLSISGIIVQDNIISRITS